MALRRKTIRYGATTIRGQADFDHVRVATSGGTVFADETTDASDTGTADVPLGTAVDDALYFGYTSRQFGGVWIDMSTNASGGTRVLEYWNGSTWVALTNTVITGALLLSADTAIRWDVPSDWATTTVDSQSAYWVRIRTTALHTTGGTISVMNGAPVEQLYSAMTIEIPETVGRTFQSVFAKIWIHTPDTGAQYDFVRIRGRIDAGAYTDLLYRTTAMPLSGESIGCFYYVDLTSVFSSYSGTNHILDLQISRLSRGSVDLNRNINHYSAELFISYEYDDTATTQACTVILPIESITGNLTTSLASIGSNQIPILTGGSGIIKQNSPVLKSFYMAFGGNIREAGTADYTFGVSLDAESEVILGDMEATAQSDVVPFFLWRRDDITTTSAHDLKARVSSVAGAVFTNFGGYAVFTFHYDHSASTELTETFIANVLEEPGYLSGATAALRGIQTRTWFTPEASMTLRQSGIEFLYSATADAGNLIIAAGGQSDRTYAVTAGVGGSYGIMHRIDSGSAAGAGLTLSTGKSTLTVNYRADGTVTNASSVCAIAYITYSYTITANRRSQCYQTLMIADQSATAVQREVTATPANPVEADYWLNAATFFGYLFSSGTPASNAIALVANKGSDLGWDNLFSQFFSIDAETTVILWCGRGREFFKRHASDPDTARFDINISRIFRLGVAVSSWFAMVSSAWWHDFQYTVSGTLSNYTGDGSGITVQLFDAVTHELLDSTTSAVGGTFSMTWYDNSVAVYCRAYQSTTKKGISVEQIASAGSFNIDLQPSGGGGGGQRSLTFAG